MLQKLLLFLLLNLLMALVCAQNYLACHVHRNMLLGMNGTVTTGTDRSDEVSWLIDTTQD